jgi:hypothetical protein
MSVPSDPISRRGIIALASLFGVSGCVDASYEKQIADDPYISLIKKDPMFAWAPPGNLHRDVYYIPLKGQPLASQESVVNVVYSVPEAAKIPDLLTLAYNTSRANGYSETGKRNADGTIILLTIDAAATTQGISLVFRAPSDR